MPGICLSYFEVIEHKTRHLACLAYAKHMPVIYGGAQLRLTGTTKAPHMPGICLAYYGGAKSTPQASDMPGICLAYMEVLDMPGICHAPKVICLAWHGMAWHVPGICRPVMQYAQHPDNMGF